jgi:predicted metalloprotease with PDZ domain
VAEAVANLPPVHYRLDFSRAHMRYIGVCLSLPSGTTASGTAGWQLSLPAWIPGSYLIRDFAKNLVGMNARTIAGESVAITPLDQQTWQLPRCDQAIEVRYDVYCADFSVRAAHVDPDHAFFNGSSVFLRVHGLERQSHSVRFEGASAPAHWRVATTLPEVMVDDRGFGDYRVDDYEALIDFPVEMGVFEVVRWSSAGVPHRMVFNHPHPKTDLARIAHDVSRICSTEIDFFGEAPFSQYLFLVALDQQGFGGLEHRDSTALIFPRDDLPLIGETEVTPAYQRFLSLCAHEYFHSWNVKRIRPNAFTQLPLARPAHTRLLWLFEGFTSYFDDWMVRRAGLISEAAYLDALAQTINRAVRGKGWSRQTLEESSFYAWTRFYQQDENAVNAIVSYYTRGALVALMLDLQLRLRGGSLAAVMREIWREFGTKPLPEGEVVERFIERIGELSLSDFFEEALRGTGPLDFASLLIKFGVQVEPLAEPTLSSVDVGAIIGGDDPRVAKVQLVFEDRPAAQAGLVSGDEIIAVDGLATSGADWGNRIRRYRAGDEVHLTGFRQGRLRHWMLVLSEPVLNQWRLRFVSEAAVVEPEALTRRCDWLATSPSADS